MDDELIDGVVNTVIWYAVMSRNRNMMELVNCVANIIEQISGLEPDVEEVVHIIDATLQDICDQADSDPENSNVTVPQYNAVVDMLRILGEIDLPETPTLRI